MRKNAYNLIYIYKYLHLYLVVTRVRSKQFWKFNYGFFQEIFNL